MAARINVTPQSFFNHSVVPLVQNCGFHWDQKRDIPRSCTGAPDASVTLFPITFKKPCFCTMVPSPAKALLHVGGGFVHMVVLQHIESLGLAALTLSSRGGRLARTKAPTDSPTSLGWRWFRISYLKPACNLKWLRDGSTSTPSTHTFLAILPCNSSSTSLRKRALVKKHRLLKDMMATPLHSLASSNQNLTQITEPLPEVTNDHVHLLMQIHPKAAPPGFKTRCISWKTC